MKTAFNRPKNILCFSIHRWDFALRRPQQLLLRFSEDTNVYFFEEPIFDAAGEGFLSYSTRSETLWMVVPHLKAGLTSVEVTFHLAELLDKFLENAQLDNWIFWYYSCPALSFSKKYKPKLVIYDCLEESLVLDHAAEETNRLEEELLKRSDLVFKRRNFSRAVRMDWDHTYHYIADQISTLVSELN